MATDWIDWAKDARAFQGGEITGVEFARRRGYTDDKVIMGIVLQIDMEKAVCAWLHDDPELISTVDIALVADSLLQNEVKPEEVDTNERYDLVAETVEMFDSKAEDR